MKGRTDQERGKRTRRLFYAALLEEIADRGYERASVNNIIRRTALSKGAFYHHFDGLDDLLAKWYALHTSQTVDVFNKGTNEHAEPADVVLNDLFRILDGDPGEAFIAPLCRIYTQAFRDSSLRPVHRRDYEAKRDLLVRLFERYAAAGTLRLTAPPEDLADCLYHGFFGLYLMHYATGDRRRLRDRVERYVRSFFSTLEVAPGSSAK